MELGFTRLVNEALKVPAWEYAVLAGIITMVVLYFMLDFHFVGDLITGLRGDRVKQHLHKPKVYRFASSSLPIWDVAEGKRLHARILACDCRGSKYLANLLVHMYGKCGSLDDALKVFESIDEPNQFSWNIMVQAYAQNGHLEGARNTFQQMPHRNVVSWNGMVTVYAQNGHLGEARGAFDRMSQWDLVSWNGMVSVYAQAGHLNEAHGFFHRMPERNVVSWNCVVAVYAQTGHLIEAADVSGKMPQQNVVSCTAMIQAYARSGHVQDATRAFDKMLERNVVSWTALTDAYATNGQMEHAKITFDRTPQHDLISWTVMIAAYAQKGHMDNARSTFESMPYRNTVSWNAILAAYAQNGLGKETIELFQEMNVEGTEVDDVSFLSILTACSHGGLLKDSKNYLISLRSDYSLMPVKEHYNCMIDILARMGRLIDAEDLIQTMPFIPDVSSWGALLGGCRIHEAAGLGEQAAENMSELEPQKAATYSLLTNIYAAAS